MISAPKKVDVSKNDANNGKCIYIFLKQTLVRKTLQKLELYSTISSRDKVRGKLLHPQVV